MRGIAILLYMHLYEVFELLHPADCQMVFSVTALCSEGPMFRSSYVQKVLCSEGPLFRRSYAQKVLCSEGPLFRRSYAQKVLCSEGSIFRRFYVQKILCSEICVQKVIKYGWLFVSSHWVHYVFETLKQRQ